MVVSNRFGLIGFWHGIPKTKNRLFAIFIQAKEARELSLRKVGWKEKQEKRKRRVCSPGIEVLRGSGHFFCLFRSISTAPAMTATAMMVTA
jgi:hypothetical protein